MIKRLATTLYDFRQTKSRSVHDVSNGIDKSEEKNVQEGAWPKLEVEILL